MKIKNPHGQKTIRIETSENHSIFLEDLSANPSEFALEVFLKSPRAAVEISGRASTSGDCQKKWRVVLHFCGADQSGKISLRGVAENESFLELDAAAVLEKESENAAAEIDGKIVLFDSARGANTPVLTVKTDRVKSASHSAAIGPIPPEILLFCASRGLSKSAAIPILRAGFLK